MPNQNPFSHETPAVFTTGGRIASVLAGFAAAQDQPARGARAAFALAAFLGALIPAPSALAVTFPDRLAIMWEYEEWSLTNASPSKANRFDIVAKVMFTHGASGETRVTEMFYDGGDTWKFRFTGTRTGSWSFTTRADGADGTTRDPDLDGHSGTVEVGPQTDPKLRGFLTHDGNRYVIQDYDGTERGYLLNVFWDEIYHNNIFGHGVMMSEMPSDLDEVRAEMDGAWANAQANGFEVLNGPPGLLANTWFEFGVNRHTDHSSQNPDLTTFRVLETMITHIHAKGGRIFLWMWGDEARQWTPVGVGGINGMPDRRLQRYIVARLGPLPGWSAEYGFDLHEWDTKRQLRDWQSYLRERFGWQHLLSARASDLQSSDHINGYSIEDHEHGDFRGPAFPTVPQIMAHLDSDTDNPHLYEERHTYTRWDLTMTDTRRLLWRTAIAGGMGGWYGFFPSSPHPYPNPEWLRCHYIFWHEHDRCLRDFERANSLTDAYMLKESSSSNYVVYKESTSSIEINLSGAPRLLPAVAVDCADTYSEIDLGLLPTSKQTVTLPHSSDWALAVGSFGGSSRGGESPSKKTPEE
jgi:hypothetical protein